MLKSLSVEHGLVNTFGYMFLPLTPDRESWQQAVGVAPSAPQCLLLIVHQVLLKHRLHELH